MKLRLSLALILVPLAATLSYATALHFQFKDMDPAPSNVDFVWPGLVAGLVFELLVLVPLFLVLRRWGKTGPVVFMAAGFALWALLSFAVYAALMPLTQALQTTVPTMLFGAVMVFVFAALVVRRTPV